MRKMLKIILATAIMMLGGAATSNAQLRFSWGVEWGCDAGIYEHSMIDFFSPIGQYIPTESRNFHNSFGGHFMTHIGLEMGKYCQASAQVGLAGVSTDRVMFPLTARFTAFPYGIHQDGLLLFAEGGAGMYPNSHGLIRPIAKAGTGYRTALSSRHSLDIMLSAQYAADSIHDFSDSIYGQIAPERIVRSDQHYVSVNLTIGISF